MDIGLSNKLSSYFSNTYSSKKVSAKGSAVDFQSKIDRKKQVFQGGDMVIPQPPRQGSFQYDNSISSKSKEDMSLDEYKQWVANEISQMPVSGWYQSTCVGGALMITEECFERMKTDSEWEKNVLGMVRKMYSVTGIMGSKMIGFQVIGASEAECYGEGIPVDSDLGLGNTDERESWWKRRHKKMEELLKEQVENAQKKAVAKRKAQKEQWMQEQWMQVQVRSHNRMQQYFAERIGNAQSAEAIVIPTVKKRVM